MDRRTFLAGVLASVAAPVVVEAQQAGKVYLIGFLGATSPATHGTRVEALRARLRELGYVDGKNTTIEYRWANGNYERLSGLAAELVRLKVDVLVTFGTSGALAAKEATSTIPIVTAGSGDVVATGLASSLARPGGNITGLSLFIPELAAKRLELLREALPHMRSAAVLTNPDNAAAAPVLRAIESTAKSLKIKLHQSEARRRSEFEDAFSAMARGRVDAVVVSDDPFFNANAGTIAALAARTRLLSAGGEEFAQVGGEIGYGVDFLDVFRRAASFVDKVLKGAKPSEIPIQQPTKFELVINLKTAKALGLTIPPTLLLRADQVIE